MPDCVFLKMKQNNITKSQNTTADGIIKALVRGTTTTTASRRQVVRCCGCVLSQSWIISATYRVTG